jgi:hypothetical protein
MLINYCLKAHKLFIAFLFLLLLTPEQASATVSNVDLSLAQVESVGQTGTEQEQIATKEKKKDKIKLNKYFFVSLLIDLAAVALIILFVYYPNYKKIDTVFTFLMFNVVIFILTYVLNEVKISMGAAFGLFAVFSMLRYRTAGIGMKDMTYLFIFIALGLISAIQLEFYELAVLVAVVFVTTLLLDTRIILKKENSNILRYEKIEMIKPEKRDELIAELRERTGLNIHRVSVNEIDFLKDTAMISYYYYD